MGRHWICRVLIAHGPALVVDSGLREHGTEFTFARASGLPWGSTGPAFGFGLHHKNLRSVHLDVEVRNRRASHAGRRNCLALWISFWCRISISAPIDSAVLWTVLAVISKLSPPEASSGPGLARRGPR